MTINSDSAFTIGDSHIVCEDYTITASDEDGQYIVLCDGCSSSEMTDVGVRLLAHSALVCLKRHDLYDKMRTENYLSDVLYNIKMLSKDEVFKDLPSTAYDATLLLARHVDDNTQIIMFGDGVLAFKKKDEKFVRIVNKVYPNGYPRYLSYRIDRYRELEFLKKEPCFEVHVAYTNNDECYEYEMPNDIEYYHAKKEVKDNIEWVALMSDGVHSFRNEKKKEINYIEVVKHLTDFKNFTGDFVKRRLNKFKKTCAKRGWTHYDDVSIAAIYLGED